MSLFDRGGVSLHGRFDLFHQSLEYLARTYFYEDRSAIGYHVAYALGPFYRGGQLNDEVLFRPKI